MPAALGMEGFALLGLFLGHHAHVALSFDTERAETTLLQIHRVFEPVAAARTTLAADTSTHPCASPALRVTLQTFFLHRSVLDVMCRHAGAHVKQSSACLDEARRALLVPIGVLSMVAKALELQATTEANIRFRHLLHATVRKMHGDRPAIADLARRARVIVVLVRIVYEYFLSTVGAAAVSSTENGVLRVEIL